MTSYWKLIDMNTADVISIGKREKDLTELKFIYENKLSTPTKLVKCFGDDKFEHDWRYLKKKCYGILKECEHNC